MNHTLTDRLSYHVQRCINEGSPVIVEQPVTITQPAEEYDVLDQHGGFTAVTKLGTLWRPGVVLKHGTIGKLVAVNHRSFYQNNNDVTQATYKVPGYGYRVVCWFDNKTGHRIA